MPRYQLATVFCLFTACASLAYACNVPVFRYALERWAPDQYEVVVLHEDELDAEDLARVQKLREASRSAGGAVNFNLRVVDTENIKDELLQRVWDERDAETSQPLLVTLYPRNAQEVPDRLVSAKPLRDDSVEQLVDSPVRRAVAKNLLSGDSAVWIFVPSGDASLDSVALKTLEAQAKHNADTLELPPQDELESDEFFRPETPIELRVGFSIVSLDRDDPKEAALLEMLLGSESDLEELNEPMAFPVIGRGRVLYALVGKGIFEDTIAIASRFVVGPCSCQVKDQNPGFDLLMNVDWDERVGGAAISEEASNEKVKPILIEIPKGK